MRSFCHIKKVNGVLCTSSYLKTKELTINLFFHICNFSFSQDELGCRVDFLLDRCFQTEREEMETMENVNKLLLQNVLPLHVASFFIGKTVRNQVKKQTLAGIEVTNWSKWLQLIFFPSVLVSHFDSQPSCCVLFSPYRMWKIVRYY